MLLAIPIVSLILGIFLLRKPGLAIEIQRRFYAKINWKIEPISMEKEIRNTKIMGLFLVGISVVVMAYLIYAHPKPQVGF